MQLNGGHQQSRPALSNRERWPSDAKHVDSPSVDRGPSWRCRCPRPAHRLGLVIVVVGDENSTGCFGKEFASSLQSWARQCFCLWARTRAAPVRSITLAIEKVLPVPVQPKVLEASHHPLLGESGDGGGVGRPFDVKGVKIDRAPCPWESGGAWQEMGNQSTEVQAPNRRSPQGHGRVRPTSKPSSPADQSARTLYTRATRMALTSPFF